MNDAMKKLLHVFLKAIAVGFVLVVPPKCLAQSDSLVDCFPLSIGNQWVYYYDHWHYDDMDPGSFIMTDTGTASYAIIDKIPFQDSLLWVFRSNRVLHHRSVYWVGDPPTVLDTMLADSAIFTVVEIRSGRHELYQQISNPVTILNYGGVMWNSVIPFQHNMPDTARVYRYYKTDSASAIRSHLTYYDLGLILDVTAARDSGLTSLSVQSTVTLWWEKAHHILLSRTLVGVKDHRPEMVPAEVVLMQNYPNPFNPSTLVSYRLPRQSYVTLKVIDVLGREIATLVNGEQTAGYKTVVWDAANIPSGVYFYLLQAGSYTETKKLVVMH
jgi:hypothetical protein